jgi:hypothetical protein
MASKLIQEGNYSANSWVVGQDDYFTLLQVSITLPIADVPITPVPLPSGTRKLTLDTNIYMTGASSAVLEKISQDTGRLTFQIKIDGKKPWTGGGTESFDAIS